jgi:hypothetical protein
VVRYTKLTASNSISYVEIKNFISQEPSFTKKYIYKGSKIFLIKTCNFYLNHLTIWYKFNSAEIFTHSFMVLGLLMMIAQLLWLHSIKWSLHCQKQTGKNVEPTVECFKVLSQNLGEHISLKAT